MCACTRNENTTKPSIEVLGSLCRDNLNRVILAHLNINSIRNKFDLLTEGLSRNVNVIIISEAKINETFPARQFHMDVYTVPYSLDRNCNRGGIMISVREDIPSKLTEINNCIEGIFIELNLRKKRWLLCGSCNPHKSFISQHLSIISKNLETLLTQYDVSLMGDFNVDKSDAKFKIFLSVA